MATKYFKPLASASITTFGIPSKKDGNIKASIAIKYSLTFELGPKNKTKSVLEYLNNKGVTPQNTGVIGFSMGSFPAIETAAKNKDLKFLILISPFNSLRNEIETLTMRSTVKLPYWIKYGIKKFPFILKHLDNIFKTKAKINRIKSPIYIIQSANDKIVPLKSTEELTKKARNLKEFIVLEEGGHNIEENKLKAFNDLSEI